jgi:hypothetical protein
MWTWNDAPLKLAGSVLAFVVGTTTSVYKGVEFIDARNDARYAKAAEGQLTGLRLEELILTIRQKAIQEQVWAIESCYGTDMFDAPGPVREQYRQMVIDLADVKMQIQSVMQAYRASGYNASDTYYHYEQPHR